MTSRRTSGRQQRPSVLRKRKTSSRPCRPSPPSRTTKTRKLLLSRDQIAGEGGHAAGRAQSAMALPWFCDELGAGDRCRGHLLYYPNVGMY